jgi:hypothetical protein
MHQMTYTPEQIIRIQALRAKRYQLLSEDPYRPDVLKTVNRKLYLLTGNPIYNVDKITTLSNRNAYRVAQ